MFSYLGLTTVDLENSKKLIVKVVFEWLKDNKLLTLYIQI